MFERLEKTGINFSNNIQSTKDFNVFSYRNFFNGGGVAIGDINNDGLSDVFFTANMGSNKLYLNKGDWMFEDISEKAGFVNKDDWSTGVTMVDINHDGWLDIYVSNAGYINGKIPESKLYINNGVIPSGPVEGRDNVSFREAAEEYGLTNKGGYATHAAFFDYDLDGDLDAFIINNSFIPVNTFNYSNKRELRAKDWPVKDFLKGGGDRFYRNDSGRFVDVTGSVGVYGSLISFGLGVTVGDVNGDYYPDVYVSNDFFERDYLYINQKNGTFKEELEQWVQHISLSSMGADIADINNDGYPDIFTTDMLPENEYRLKTTASFENIDIYQLKLKQGFYHQFMQNTLQVNNQDGKFLETAYFSGVAASDWSWGALIFDADNDGLPDIYVCNGIYHDVTDQDFIDFFADEIIQRMVFTGEKEEVDQVINKMPSTPLINKFYKNKGGLKFVDEGMAAGFTESSFSNGAAYGDLDNDGDLDLVVNNVNENAFVYRNNSRELGNDNYIGISLRGNGQNTFAIGSTVKIYTGQQVLTRELIPSRGFQSSVDYKMIIGLGRNTQVDSLVIIWPDRSYTKRNQPAVNTIHILEQQDQKNFVEKIEQPPDSTFLIPVKNNFEKHNEDDYIDFYTERNIPVMLSRKGPRATCGDVNGDGLDDVFICGAAGQPGQLYLQTRNGFKKKEGKMFDKEIDFEDVAAVFFDCDSDKDLDLFLGSGGNHHRTGSREMQNRLYKNDGKGNFKIENTALPRSGMNCSVAIAGDFDADNDLDLFVGSNSMPQNYGMTPFSYLLANDGKGRFTDVAFTKNEKIAGAGMVTGAVWSDITGDKKKELVIVGEWMAPKIFSYSGDHFEEVKTNMSELQGWWHTVTAGDLDGDGDDDLVLGNNGENYYLKPDEKNPLKLWINDFDGNGTFEKIITRTVQGKDMPVFMKREITDQIPALKKQNLKHRDYAKKSIQDLFPPALLEKSTVKSINYTNSCIAINEGNGKFTVQKLPTMVQLSCVNAILCADINGDGNKDLIMGGNDFGFLPQFSRLDASFGHVLINNGKAKFELVPSSKSGLNLRGVIRDIKEIHLKDGNYILIMQNDDYPALFRAYAASNMK